MRRLAIVVGVGVIVSGTAMAQDERREVAAHVHGESVLRIAVEGNVIVMDFDTPGLDVLGFEHPPGTPEERSAVERVTAILRDPLSLFDFGAAAGCAVVTADVDFLVEEESGAPTAEPPSSAVADVATEQITNHTGFEGLYTLTCGNPGAIRELRLGFLQMFPNAKAVEVQLVTDKGQTAFDVERPTVSASLAGLF